VITIVRREVVQNSRGKCLNNIHPLKFSLVKAAVTVPLQGLLCRSLYAKGRTKLGELRVVGTAGMDY
jgi:hypothetical protein